MFVAFMTLLISLSSFSQIETYVQPSKYRYSFDDKLDEDTIKIEIRKTSEILIFKKTGQECDAYVDSCFLSFSNKANPNYKLYGTNPCINDYCKKPHPKFLGYGITLQDLSL